MYLCITVSSKQQAASSKQQAASVSERSEPNANNKKHKNIYIDNIHYIHRLLPLPLLRCFRLTTGRRDA